MGSKRKLVSGSGDEEGDDRTEEEIQLELEKSIKELYQEDTLQFGDPEMVEVKKVDLMSKLVDARLDEADLERMARRMFWRREVRRTIDGNAEFKEIKKDVPLAEMEGKEKIRMSRLSMEWRDAFKKERASALFPQVLDTMMKSTSDLMTPLDLLDYRRVCKASKEEIDTLLPKIVAPKMWKDDFSGIPYQGIFKFEEAERAKAFTIMCGDTANPFFTRNIDIFLTGRSSCSPDFLPVIEEILRRWGNQLLSAKLYVFRRMTPEDMYDLLVIWLKLMSNLQSLRLDLIIKDSDEITPEAHLAKLSEQMAKNPLPSMPHLINIFIENSTPSPMTHAILSKFSKCLEKVEVGFDMDNLLINDTLSNLSPPTPVSSEGSFSSMQQLSVCYRLVGSEEDVRKILKNFNNWRLPLRKLALGVHNTRIQGDRYVPLLMLNNKEVACKGVFLEMPQLEELYLTLSECIEMRSLDFLLPCKALKVLSLHNTRFGTNCKSVPEQQSTEDKGIFQFPTDPADKDRVYRSPIWKLLPELKLVVLTSVLFLDGEQTPVTLTYNYTREKYLQQGTGE